MVIWADQAKESKSVETFKRLCENASDVSIREHACELIEQQKRAEAMAKDFENNKSST